MSPSITPRRVVVLGGGVSAEREVSLASSRAVHAALAPRHEAEWIDLTEEALPGGLDPRGDVVFPVLHGTFGEDGGLQALLEAEGFAYVGCDARSSALCMDKVATKAAVGAVGVPVAPHLCFVPPEVPTWEAVARALGTSRAVLKPAAQGSSVGLHFPASEADWAGCLRKLDPGPWMVEPRLAGHDVTVGILGGEPLGVVGIFPEGGAPYDYTRKYTAGATRYEVPAALPAALTEALRAAAKAAFAAAGCRDFARVDFILHDERFTFLEINTIPGLTATSLLPKSASVRGLGFAELVGQMLAPALGRYHCGETLHHG
jgi:D-alanine-D-alanine ligase